MVLSILDKAPAYMTLSPLPLSSRNRFTTFPHVPGANVVSFVAIWAEFIGNKWSDKTCPGVGTSADQNIFLISEKFSTFVGHLWWYGT